MNTSRRRFLALLGSAALPPRIDAAPPPVSSAYAAKVLSRKPVGYWRLGDAADSAIADEARLGHDGVANGAVGFAEPGALKRDANTALKFDGHSYVEIPSAAEFSQPASGKGLTVEAWMRPDLLEFDGETSDPHVHWLGKGEPDRYEWAFRFYSRNTSRPNRISAYLWNPAGELGSGAYFEDPIKAGEWIHVVACFDPSGARDAKAGVAIYKNGVFRGGPANQPGSLYRAYHVTSSAGSAPLRLGTRSLKSFFTGALDEVVIYPRVLRPAEIMENFRAGITR